MLDAWQDRPQRRRVTPRPVGDDALGCYARPGDRTFEEGPCRSGVAPLAEVGVHNLAVPIDRPIAVSPTAIEAAVRLVYSPFLAYPPAVSVGSLREKR